MADIVDESTRSRMMSGIRSKNTKPELLVRKALFAAGFRFRLYRNDIIGVPDIVLSGRRVAIFVHGCFWHMHKGCRHAKLPATRREFWLNKLSRNVERDATAQEVLLRQGWRVLVIWECVTKDNELMKELPVKLKAWINGSDSSGQLSSAADTSQ